MNLRIENVWWMTQSDLVVKNSEKNSENEKDSCKKNHGINLSATSTSKHCQLLISDALFLHTSMAQHSNRLIEWTMLSKLETHWVSKMWVAKFIRADIIGNNRLVFNPHTAWKIRFKKWLTQYNDCWSQWPAFHIQSLTHQHKNHDWGIKNHWSKYSSMIKLNYIID